MATWNFKDGGRIYFSQGKFDQWCVYIEDENNGKSAPKDSDYFFSFKKISEVVGLENLYNEFLEVYDYTTNQIDLDYLTHIRSKSEAYSGLENAIEKLLVTLYMTMLAEENRKNTKLGKRIKRLGLHMYLFEDLSIKECTDGLRQGWQTLDRMSKERGF